MGWTFGELNEERARELAAQAANVDPWTTLGIGADVLEKTMSDGLGAFEGERAVGCAVLTFDGVLQPYLKLLYAVAPGQGIGSALMAECERRAFERSRNLFLLVSDFNHPAIEFYERHGYKKIGLLEDFIVPGKHEIIMRKRCD
ncbi:MAG: GNAT family N-acetyltransferase [Armatimonadetes bacterium]|nr:GNAT family N-acetyltransferase [Armatimonadota bacterium]